MNKTITLYENTDQLITASIDKIVVEIFNKEQNNGGGKTVLLTGCSPLAGTTSTCIGLSIAMANTKHKVLLVDCDMRKVEKYKKLNERITVGLSDYLLQDSSEKDILLECIVYPTNVENLSYIPCGNHSENATRMLCSDEMKVLINEVKNEYDIVIFDLPSLTIVPDAQILFKSVDGIVLVAALGETRKRQIKESKRKVKPFGQKYYGMIVNKVQLDMYRWNSINYDYYFLNKKGEQRLKGNNKARKKYENAKRR